MNADMKRAIIINDFINGNLSSFGKAVKRMSKKELLYLYIIMKADGLNADRILNYL